jgi:hypothetical protein
VDAVDAVDVAAAAAEVQAEVQAEVDEAVATTVEVLHKSDMAYFCYVI